MIRRPPRSTLDRSSAASDVYKRQLYDGLNFDKVAPKAELIMKLFADGTYDQITLIYNKFKNAAVQILTEEQYLPVLPLVKEAGDKSVKSDHIMEPDRATIVREIIPKSLKIQLLSLIHTSKPTRPN